MQLFVTMSYMIYYMCSWDYGPVHFISIDTSTDFTDAPDQVSGGSHVFKAGNFGSYEGEYMDWVEQVLLLLHTVLHYAYCAMG